MKEKSTHRQIVIISLVVGLISLIASAVGILFNSEEMIILPLGIFCNYSLTVLLTSLAVKYQDKNWARKTTRYSFISLPFLIIAVVLLGNYWSEVSVPFIVILIVVTYLALLYLFVYTNPIALTGTIILLLLLVTGIFLKRNHLFGAGYAITFSCATLSVGSLMFSVRCIFLSEKITYFRNVAFYGGVILSLAFFGIMFKTQHWPLSGPFLIGSFMFLIFGSMYVLITLHSSGFVEWKPFHKKIFRRILIPWAFILIVYLSRFMIPELDALIWSPDSKPAPEAVTGFGMKEYTIIDKNGLNPR